jgi:hypothetical protein
MQLHPYAGHSVPTRLSAKQETAFGLSRPPSGERFHSVKRATRCDSNFLQRTAAAARFTHEVF